MNAFLFNIIILRLSNTKNTIRYFVNEFRFEEQNVADYISGSSTSSQEFCIN